MKPSDAAQILGISASTIRAWTLNEFKTFFSHSAQGGTGAARDLDDQDLRILHYIALLKKRGAASDSVVATLQQARSRGWRDLPELPDRPVNFAPVPMIPTAAADAALDAERRALLREVAFLQNQIDRLETRLDERGREVEDLRAKLAAAEKELEFRRSGRLGPDEHE